MAVLKKIVVLHGAREGAGGLCKLKFTDSGTAGALSLSFSPREGMECLLLQHGRVLCRFPVEQRLQTFETGRLDKGPFHLVVTRDRAPLLYGGVGTNLTLAQLYALLDSVLNERSDRAKLDPLFRHPEITDPLMREDPTLGDDLEALIAEENYFERAEAEAGPASSFREPRREGAFGRGSPSSAPASSLEGNGGARGETPKEKVRAFSESRTEGLRAEASAKVPTTADGEYTTARDRRPEREAIGQAPAQSCGPKDRQEGQRGRPDATLSPRREEAASAQSRGKNDREDGPFRQAEDSRPSAREESAFQSRSSVREEHTFRNRSAGQGGTAGREPVRPPAAPELPAQTTYYDTVKEEIEKLFGRFPHEPALEDLITDSRFVRVQYDERGKYYVVGVVYDQRDPAFICYGVPEPYAPAPPKELSGFSAFVPKNPARPYGDGYFMMFQSARTGQTLCDPHRQN